jgi:hypothetical protein
MYGLDDCNAVFLFTTEALRALSFNRYGEELYCFDKCVWLLVVRFYLTQSSTEYTEVLRRSCTASMYGLGIL